MQELDEQNLAKIASDPDNKVDCSSRLLLDQIADKWSVLILAALCQKPLRFNELKRYLDGITQKALTQALRRLERNGILDRRVIPSSQIRSHDNVFRRPSGFTVASLICSIAVRC